MDFDAAAQRSGYTIYTDEFDEITDIRETYTDATLAEFRREAEGYLLHGRPDASVEAYNPDDADDLEKAVDEMSNTLDRIVSEIGLLPEEAVIGFLMDTSGSCRQLRPIYARAIQRVCAVLEAKGFETVVAGHTTAKWKGGQSREKWLANGKPMNPGRLNDLLLTVYKDAGEPLQDGDLRLYGLNSPSETYKENIDGEALAWFAEKIVSSDKPNIHMAFVSDGDFSIDDSTIWSNTRDILSSHRKAVIEEIISDPRMTIVQIVAEREPTEASTEVPRFGGIATRSSHLVKACAQAIEHSLRMGLKPARAVSLTQVAKGPM